MASNDRENQREYQDGHDDPWEACPAGELTQMVDRLDAAQRHSRSKQVYGTALISTGIFACVVLALGSLMGPSGSNYGGISCSYCRNHLPDYYPHLAGELVLEDAELVASMKTHLEKCTFCRAKFRALYPDFELTQSTAIRAIATRPALELAMLPMFTAGQQSALY